MIDEEFYPYIFTENLYLIPSKGNPKSTVVEKPLEDKKVVSVPPEAIPSSQKAAMKILHPGNSSVLSVVFWGPTLQFSSADQELLHKIIQACKLNPADIGLFHADNSTGLLFTDEIAASKAIVFCSKEALHSAKQAQIKLYQQHPIAGKTLLLSDPLDVLAKDTTLKGNLWKSLQALLGL